MRIKLVGEIKIVGRPEKRLSRLDCPQATLAAKGRID